MCFALLENNRALQPLASHFESRGEPSPHLLRAGRLPGPVAVPLRLGISVPGRWPGTGEGFSVMLRAF